MVGTVAALGYGLLLRYLPDEPATVPPTVTSASAPTATGRTAPNPAGPGTGGVPDQPETAPVRPERALTDSAAPRADPVG